MGLGLAALAGEGWPSPAHDGGVENEQIEQGQGVDDQVG